MHLISVVLLFAVCSVDAYNILVVFPYGVKSMSIYAEGFVRNLINAGHKVTYITPCPTKSDYGINFHQIDVSSNFDALPDDGTMNIGVIMSDGVRMNDIGILHDFAILTSINTLENKDVQQLLEDTNQKFDAVIADLFETELFSALSALYDCPMIWSYSLGAQFQVLRLIDQPTNPAYTVTHISSNVPPLNFQQRLEELWTQIKWNWLKRFSLLPKEEAAYEKYFKPLLEKRNKQLPNYQDLVFNASLIFANEHYAFGTVPSVPPNFKLIGGSHMEIPTKPLPKNLQDLMDNSSHGVIYFSMGSTWKSKDIPKSVTKGLMEIFAELKQTVLWKYEDTLSNVPKNVHLLNWAPQSSILAHPNCLLFISHGGLFSSIETLHFGVPTIGIPIYMDQFINVKKSVAAGYSIQVPLTYNLPRDLKAAIQTMLNDPQYRQKAKELSSIYHDRPVLPAKEMVHWVEHVIRTKGAPHLRSPSVYTTVIQKMYLDLVTIILLTVIVVYVTVKMLCGRSIQKARKEKKN